MAAPAASPTSVPNPPLDQVCRDNAKTRGIVCLYLCVHITSSSSTTPHLPSITLPCIACSAACTIRHALLYHTQENSMIKKQDDACVCGVCRGVSVVSVSVYLLVCVMKKKEKTMKKMT